MTNDRSRSSLGALVDPTAYRADIDIDGIDDERAVGWFESMVRIRLAEEAIGDMVASGEAKCPCHLGIGQEAVAVGVADHIRSTDRCLGAHRSHSHYLALGGDLDQLMAEVLGRATGCSHGFGGSMHLRSPDVGLIGTVPIVGATIPIAVGCALAAKLEGAGDVAVSFLGDGATEEGIFHESLNLAASMELPVLFVVENNLYSSHMHIGLRQPDDSVSRFADAHRIGTAVVDGNDVVAVSSIVGEMVAEMRRDPSPTLIEAVTYRWRGHVGDREDLDVGVERTDNLAEWKERDPIARLVRSIEGRGLGALVDGVRNRVADEVVAALAFARDSKFPHDDELIGTVYAGGRP
jgi:pyruvate dehydrogenase E1 component alpha subunit